MEFPVIEQSNKADVDGLMARQASGRYYHLSRHYAVKDASGTLYDVSLHIGQRIIKTFCELFGVDYFARLSSFKGKHVSVVPSSRSEIPQQLVTDAPRKPPACSHSFSKPLPAKSPISPPNGSKWQCGWNH